MAPPTVDYYCRQFRPNTFDPSRCSSCLRPDHMHLSSNADAASPHQDGSKEWAVFEAQSGAAKGWTTLRAPSNVAHNCGPSSIQEAEDDISALSEASTSSSGDDVSGGWTYEWSLVHSLSPEWELNICDTDIQPSTTNQSECLERSRFFSPEGLCVAQRDMTQLDPSPNSGTERPWMDERRGRSCRASESRRDREKESGYVSPDRRGDGERQMEEVNKVQYRYYERGHPLPSNYALEPKACIPYRNVNLGVPSQRRNPETYMQETWRSESPERYTYHSNFRRGTDTQTNSPTRHGSVSPDRHKLHESPVGTGRRSSLLRSQARSHSSSHSSYQPPSNGPSRHASGRSSPSRRRGSVATRTASPSRATVSHRHTDSLHLQNGKYNAQRESSQELRSPSQASNKHSLDSEKLYRNLESISRRGSSTVYRNSFEGSQASPRTRTAVNSLLNTRSRNSREISPPRNGYSPQSPTQHREASSRDSRLSPSQGSRQGSSHSLLNLPLSHGSPTSRCDADSQVLSGSRSPVAFTDTDKGIQRSNNVNGDRSRSNMRRGMEALLISEPKKTAVETEEVGMTLDDYIVLADVPKIQLESEEELTGLRWRNQSPSPCRDQTLRTYRYRDEIDVRSLRLEPDERGRGRERGRDRREKCHDSENERSSRRHSTTSIQSSENQSGKHRPLKVKKQAPPERQQTQMVCSRNCTLQYQRCSVMPKTADSTITEGERCSYLKGWMSRLDEHGKWTKHWFVLCDTSLRFYRDSEAEESDDLDGEIDLTSCVNVSDCDVKNNYGLQIQTKRAVFTLSATTSRIRRNWVKLLRQTIHNNMHQSDSGNEKENPRCHRLSPGQPPARFTYEDSGYGPTTSTSTATTANHRGRPSHQTADGDLGAGSSPASQREDGEGWDREQVKRLEERNKWFEEGVPGNEMGSRWDSMELKRGCVPALVLETMDSEVSRKWAEFEKLSFRDMNAQSLIGAQAYQSSTPQASQSLNSLEMCQSSPEEVKQLISVSEADISSSKGALPSINGAQPIQTNTAEALQTEAISVRKQVESIEMERAEMGTEVDDPCCPGAPCRAKLEATEAAHRRALQELQEKHAREIRELEEQKDRMLHEERQTAAKAMESLRAAHREQLEREVEKAKRLAGGAAHTESPPRSHLLQADVLHSESDMWSERYSQTCLKQSSWGQETELSHKERELEKLRRENQELKAKLAEEISRMRYFITGQRMDVLSPVTTEISASEIETLLRAKDNEVQHLKREISCLQNEVQSLTKEKEASYERYKEA